MRPLVELFLLVVLAGPSLGDDDLDADEGTSITKGVCYSSLRNGKRLASCCVGWEPASKTNTTNSASSGERGVPNCRPICSPECVNADCTEPDLCTCWHGFAHVPSALHMCQPHCAMRCINATCVGPNKCDCKPGYRRLNGNVCVPDCQGCVDHCVAPGVCVPFNVKVFGGALEGRPVKCGTGYYRKNGPMGRCEPLCSGGCVNGECEAPGKCRCHPGYAPASTGGTCVPACEPPCGPNAACAAPGKCRCEQGYRYQSNDSSTCEPECSEPCVNGRCAAPDRCECLPGYALASSSYDDEDYGDVARTCEAVCKPSCGVHATCTSPDVCVCNDGYQMSEPERNCLPICSKPCVESGGHCKSPNVCACPEKLKWMNTTGRCEQRETLAMTTTPTTTTLSSACAEGCMHGTCDGRGVCVCRDGWLGTNCSVEDKRGCRRCDKMTERCDIATSKCICKLGWTSDDCSQPCPLMNGSATFILNICPHLSDCECFYEDLAEFCPPEASVLCGKAAADARQQRKEPALADERWWLPWAAGTAALALIVVTVASALTAMRHRRKPSDKLLPNDAKDSTGALCQMQEIDLLDWRFIPRSEMAEQ